MLSLNLKAQVDKMTTKQADKYLMECMLNWDGHAKGLTENLHGIEARIEVLLKQKDELTLAILQLQGMSSQARMLATGTAPLRSKCDAVH